MRDPYTPPPLARRVARWLLLVAFAPLALVDLLSSVGSNPVVLLSGVAATVILLLGDRMPLVWRASVVGGGSWTLTVALTPLDLGVEQSWGLLEAAAVLRLLGTVARRVQPTQLAMGLGTVLGAAVLAMPLRAAGPDWLASSFLLTFVVAAVVGAGCYLRVADAGRLRAIESVRQSERLELARDLHDFVAHHVTGIVVQAQAARTVGTTSPEQVEPLLRSIEKAGTEALASMRRLVQVLREEGSTRARPTEGFAQLAALAEAFSSTGPKVWLEISREAYAARLAPEVSISAHRVVQEALTNVRRHAPGTVSISVRVGVEGGALTVTVINQTAPHGGGRGAPLGGYGGFGLVGLRERVEAVGGELRAGPLPYGGWQVTARLPVLSVAGS